jgi:hypothetical protein
VLYANGLSGRASLPPADRVEAINNWCLVQLPALNQDILAGRRRPEEFAAELSPVLADLPSVHALSAVQAQQLVVILGLVGASAGRHYQERAESGRSTPERAFDELLVGATAQPFLRYFAQLTEHTRTGHPPRDSYAALVRWNTPAARVRWGDRQLADLPSIFRDGQVRTYSGTLDESRFFGLLKASEVLELAVNRELRPLSDGYTQVSDDEALLRIGRACVLLDALRELNVRFINLAPENGMRVDYFMDVFRQYAIHWTPGDIPPSGALDVQSLIRDLLIGIDLPEYPSHLRRVFPGLLDTERATLTELMERDSLPQTALHQAGLTRADLDVRSPRQLEQLVTGCPVLAALYLLLNAHARMAGVHLRLAKHFLFAPQHARELAGLGDPGVVSNREGTTGMTETWLEKLTRVRHHHMLKPLHVIPTHTLESLSRVGPIRAESAAPNGLLVEFVAAETSALDLGIPKQIVRGFDHNQIPTSRGAAW